MNITPINDYVLCEYKENDSQGGIITTREKELVVIESSLDLVKKGKRLKIKGKPIESAYGVFVKGEDIICTY